MRVARLYGAGTIRVEEAPKPQPGPGETLLRIRRVGICGSDRHYYRHGGIGEDKMTLPLILGHEVAGIVEAVGKGAQRVQEGQRVALDPAQPCGHCEFCRTGHPNLCENLRFLGAWPVDGGMQEWLVYPADLLVPLPQAVSLNEGVLLETLGVALHAAYLGKIQVGNSVAILGAGPVGLLIEQVAKLSGAGRIFVTDKLENRLEKARAFGADEALQVSDVREVSQEILRITAGRGVDVVFEAADAGETVQTAATIARPGGTIVIVGIAPRGPIYIPSNLARRKGLTVKFSRRMKHTYPTAMNLLLQQRVNLAELVTHHFPLDEVQKAFDTVADYRDGVLKAMIDL